MKIYYREDIKNIIKQRLKKQSQKDIAEELGIHRSILNRFLKDKDGLEVIADKLGFEILKGFIKKKEQMNRPQCKVCKIPLSIGKALVNPIVRSKDFANDLDYGVTLTTDTTKAKLRECWKCLKCGYSKEVKK